MKFAFTPDEGQETARTVAKHLAKTMKVFVEQPFSTEAPYRTTLLARMGDLTVLVEAQGTVDYHRELRDLATWLSARREYTELYIAASHDAGMVTGQLREMKKDGVGLYLVDKDKRVTPIHNPRNPALVVRPEPTLRYGDCEDEVRESLEKFNNGNRKDGLRDMCEIAERETEKLALLGVRKGHLKMSESDVQQKDWAGQIDTLASVNAHKLGVAPIMSQELKDDLRSLTRGRNLVDHKVIGRRAEQKRQKQFVERMMQGPRLIAELVAMRRKLR